MKRALLAFLLLPIFSASCQQTFSPWGIWNDYPLSTEAKARSTTYGKFFENGSDGLWMLENYQEYYKYGEKIAVIAFAGEYVRIDNWKRVEGGILFTLVGDGTKKDPISGKTLWQENTRIQVEMKFLSEDECTFRYVSREDSKGYSISAIIRENVVYKRSRVARTK